MTVPRECFLCLAPATREIVLYLRADGSWETKPVCERDAALLTEKGALVRPVGTGRAAA